MENLNGISAFKSRRSIHLSPRDRGRAICPWVPVYTGLGGLDVGCRFLGEVCMHRDFWVGNEESLLGHTHQRQ